MTKTYDIYTNEKLAYYEKKFPMYTYERTHKITRKRKVLQFYGVERAQVTHRMYGYCAYHGYPFYPCMFDIVKNMKENNIIEFSTLWYNYRIVCNR